MYINPNLPTAKRHTTRPPTIFTAPRTELGRRLQRRFRMSAPVADAIADLAGVSHEAL